MFHLLFPLLPSSASLLSFPSLFSSCDESLSSSVPLDSLRRPQGYQSLPRLLLPLQHSAPPPLPPPLLRAVWPNEPMRCRLLLLPPLPPHLSSTPSFSPLPFDAYHQQQHHAYRHEQWTLQSCALLQLLLRSPLQRPTPHIANKGTHRRIDESQKPLQVPFDALTLFSLLCVCVCACVVCDLFLL